MGKVIGKVVATEKNPSTMEEFYFWTRPEMILNPFDVVKVEHIKDSVTYGVVEEISHITDTANFMSDYISNDFGDVETNQQTFRIGMNYVKARIVGNSKDVYIPVFDGKKVCMAQKEEIAEALGLSKVKNPVPCGYLEMYKGTSDTEQVQLPVNVDSRFLIGPEGAHLNISGISGLASKTSYSMFLLKGIQDRCLKIEEDKGYEENSRDEDVAFVIFNVKGKDLLAIDEMNDFEHNEKEKNETLQMYETLGLTPSPFKNVTYFYPYSKESVGRHKNSWNTYLDKETVKKNIESGKAKKYVFEYEKDKNKLDLMFASLDDPAQTMESILNFIENDHKDLKDVSNWKEFLDRIKQFGQAGQSQRSDKEITVQSWRKFYRIVNKSIRDNRIFKDPNEEEGEIRLEEALSEIKKNDVYVIDIAKLNEDMQCFVFGTVIQTIYNLQLGVYDDIREDSQTPSRIVVFIDELNKYASSDVPKSSPILRQILDIAERGRSLGIVLFGAEQFKSAIHPRVTGNCSTFAYGRTNSIELAKKDYKYIPSIYRSMMTRLQQGELIIENPTFRSLLNIKFPKPIYKQFK